MTRTEIRPGDLYVIKNGFVCHTNTFFTDYYLPFAAHESIETACNAPFIVIATKRLTGDTVHYSPTVALLLRLKDGLLCSTYLWDGDLQERLNELDTMYTLFT